MKAAKSFSPFTALRPALLAVMALAALPAAAQEPPSLARLVLEPAAEAAADSNKPGAADPARRVDAAAESLGEGQEQSAGELLSRIAEFEASLASLETSASPYSLELAEQQEALAGLYEAAGQHEEAIAHYESALHNLRVNQGLFTPAQESLVRALIRNHAALGQLEEEDQRRGYLYYLAGKNHEAGSPELLAAAEDWADWNLRAYHLKRQQEAGARVRVSTSVTGMESPFSPSDYIAVRSSNGLVYYVPRSHLGMSSPGGAAIHTRLPMDPRLRTASELYEEIAASLQEGQAALSDSAVPALGEIQRKRANIDYIRKLEEEQMLSQSGASDPFRHPFSQQPTLESNQGFLRGRDNLLAVLEARRAEEDADPVRVARALLDLADWYLSYDRSSQAEDYYRQAWQTLREAGLAEEEVEKVLLPHPALEIPMFASRPFSREIHGIAPDEPMDYLGHIDVALSVDEHGHTRRVRILDTSEGTSGRIRRALEARLEESRMRPAIREGELEERRDLQLRYYYSY